MRYLVLPEGSDLPDLNAASNYLLSAYEVDPDRAACLSNLETALLMLYRRTGDLTVLAETVRAGRAAVAASPDGSPGLASRLNSLGGALRFMFDRTGDPAVLAESVQAARAAVAATAGRGAR